MIRWLRTVACLLIAALVTAFAYAASQTPMPPGTTPGNFLHRTLTAELGLLDVHLLHGDDRLDGARRLVALDPDLKQIGSDGATVLAKTSPDLKERIDAAQALVDHDRGSQQLLVDTLALAISSDDLNLLQVARGHQSRLTPANQTDIRTDVATQATGTTSPAILAIAVNDVAGNPAGIPDDVRLRLVRRSLDDSRLDLLDATVTIARSLAAPERSEFADRLVEPLAVLWLGGDWQRAIDLALSIARTPTVLNVAGTHTTDPAQAFAYYTEAHQLAPNDIVIAANWATLSKRTAALLHDATDVELYDAALDQGLSRYPDVTSWQQARDLTVVEYSYLSPCQPLVAQTL